MSGEFTYGGERGELAARLRRLDQTSHITDDDLECEIVTVKEDGQLTRECHTHRERWALPPTYLRASDSIRADTFDLRVRHFRVAHERDVRDGRVTGVNPHSSYLLAVGMLEALVTPGNWHPARRSHAETVADVAAILDALAVATRPGEEP